MKDFKVALQLYSVREDMEADMYGTLKQVKEMGYDYVEFAGYFGKSAEEVRKMLDELGLTCISVHQGYEFILEKGQEAADYLKTIGAKFCAIPWMGLEKHIGSDLWEQTKEEITQVAKLLKENGIQMLYHNHEFEFEKYQDKFILDWFYEEIPADLMQTQLDTCWVHYAGQNPAEYMLKYEGRAPILHLKDFVCKNLGSGPVYALIDADGKEGKKASREDNGFQYRPLGTGLQDFPAILAAAEKVGTEYVVVEQDQSPDQPALVSAKQSREYLRTLGL